MENQRGITVSSGLGAIGEEVLTNRLMKTIKFTQAQARGRKGGCTTDHIFILKGLISLAMKKGQELIITFFDIKKAYDRADMDDMLYIVHQQGFEGKIWRLTKSMNEELTAKVKTKAGLTREIRREKGGKQGGKLMVPLFAKMMDRLPEEMNEVETLGIKVDDMKIPALVYVDDATSLAIGYTQQQITLDAINEFAIKHKLEWGAEKCKVMEIGSHKEKKTEWKLGEKIITNCQDYKYLGQTISRDGKSKENLSAIFSKVKATVRAIITCAKSKVMKNIETDVVLKLHEACTIPTFLTNSETWSLNAEERKEADKIEMWALKDMFGLPITTPNAGIVFALGTLFSTIRIAKKQLIYLHKILRKEQGNWVKGTLVALEKNDTGWAKTINDILEQWGLETDWDKIEAKTEGEWRREIDIEAELMNKKRLAEECHVKERGCLRPKTKTKTIIEQLNEPSYIRKPINVLPGTSILEARAIMMGRYGMLDCGANYCMKYGGKDCKVCHVLDNEDHRLNYCSLYKDVNLYDQGTKIDFCGIYSDDLE